MSVHWSNEFSLNSVSFFPLSRIFPAFFTQTQQTSIGPVKLIEDAIKIPLKPITQHFEMSS